MAKLKGDLRGRVEHPIAQPAVEHANNALHTGLGAMFSPQSRGQRVLIEHRCALIWNRRRRRIHEGFATRK